MPVVGDVDKKSSAIALSQRLNSSELVYNTSDLGRVNETTLTDVNKAAGSGAGTAKRRRNNSSGNTKSPTRSIHSSGNNNNNNNNNNSVIDAAPNTNGNDQNHHQDNNGKTKDGVMYSDFLLLIFLGLLLFLFCTLGALVIYVIETEDATLLTKNSHANSTNNSALANAKNVREIYISFADYFDSAVIKTSADTGAFEQSATSLLRFVFSEAGIASERLQISTFNSTHIKVAIKPEYVFDVYGSLFFSFDVITTIGFGQRYPVTNAGKLFTTLMTLIGCPLIVLFCDVLAKTMKMAGFRIRHGVFCISSSRSRFIEKQPPSCDIRSNTVHTSNSTVHLQTKQLSSSQDSNQPPNNFMKSAQVCRRSCSALFLESIGVIIFVLIPSMAFCIQESDWTYLDSVYFSINALSTTGFGDYIAGENVNSPVLTFYRFIYVTWLLVGMAWWNAYNDTSAERLRRMCDFLLRPLARCLNKREQAAMMNRDKQSRQPLLEQLSPDDGGASGTAVAVRSSRCSPTEPSSFSASIKPTALQNATIAVVNTSSSPVPSTHQSSLTG